MAFPWAAAAVGAQAGLSLGGNLLSIRANKKQQERANEFNIAGYNKERQDNRKDALTAWERETDIAYMMQKYKDAGINPYMVTGQSFNAPTSSSNSQKEYSKADLSGYAAAGQSAGMIAQIPMQVAQLKLIQAQQENIEADTARKQVETQQSTVNLDVSKKYADPTANATLENIYATKNNTIALSNLIPQQVEGQRLENIIKDINAANIAQEKKLAIEAQTLGNKRSQAEINNLKAQAEQIKAATEKMRVEMEKLNNEIKTGNLTQQEIQARTNAIIQKLPEEIKAIQRSNVPDAIKTYEWINQRPDTHTRPVQRKYQHYDKIRD
jgi:hypothetical protein